MVIVVDTNVFVGACLGMGASSAVVGNCIRGLHTPLMGTTLLAEYEDVLGRNVVFRKSRLDVGEREELLDIFLAACRWTPIYFGWRPNLADEGDNHLIELAVAGHASHIVSRNLRDLRRAELHFPELRALTPEHFLREVTS
ncbi:MAG: PIN domain-containing protein [Pseudomonadota bacterium]|nr:PIN domain-containing protein [Pseudomonadota bacterium]